MILLVHVFVAYRADLPSVIAVIATAASGGLLLFARLSDLAFVALAAVVLGYVLAIVVMALIAIALALWFISLAGLEVRAT